MRFLVYGNRTSLNKALTRKNGYWLTNLSNRKLLKCLQRQTRNLSQDTKTERSFPSVEEIKKYSPEQLLRFLESGDLYLTNNDIEMIEKNDIAGEDFLLLKEDDLYRIGLSIAPAKRMIQLIREVSKTSNLVHVFIDNSNIWIEGKYTVGNLERLGTFDLDRNSYYFKQLQIDYGRLLTTVQCGRKLGSAPLLIGSRPSPNDSLWACIRDQGFKVDIFDGDIKSHREKKLELVLSAGKTIMFNDPGVLVLITGDRDYRPLVKQAQKFNWTAETWFWSSGTSRLLKSDTIFRSLNNCYRTFSYGLGPDLTGKTDVLEVTDGNIRSLKNKDVLEWFSTLNLFGWWDWEGRDSVRFYFNNSNYLEMVKNWILHNYQEVRIQEKLRMVRQVPRKGILDAQEDQMGNSNVSMLNLENATACLTLDGPRQWAKLTPVDRGFNEIREIKIFKDIHKIGRDSKNDTVIKDVGISRNHCVITKVTKQLERDYYETTIQKCSSNPRLWVNGVQIGYPYTMVISPGDIISFPSLELDAHVAYKFEVLLDLNSVLTNFNDKYRTLGVLGQGAFARVTCVQQLSTSRLYACKQIHTSVVRTGTNLQVSSPLAIDREIRILKTANHPNITRCEEIFYYKDEIRIIMEYAVEGDLSGRLQRGPMNELETRAVFKQLFQGIQYLHNMRVVHRDLKPQNILIFDQQLLVKITDFGISGFITSTKLLQTRCGTPLYVAPEVAGAAARYDEKADLWSLGVILYQCLSCELPFTDPRAEEKAMKGQYDFSNAIWRGISLNAKSLIRKLLQIDPRERIPASLALKDPFILSEYRHPDTFSYFPVIHTENLPEKPLTFMSPRKPSGVSKLLTKTLYKTAADTPTSFYFTAYEQREAGSHNAREIRMRERDIRMREEESQEAATMESFASKSTIRERSFITESTISGTYVESRQDSQMELIREEATPMESRQERQMELVLEEATPESYVGSRQERQMELIPEEAARESYVASQQERQRELVLEEVTTESYVGSRQERQMELIPEEAARESYVVSQQERQRELVLEEVTTESYVGSRQERQIELALEEATTEPYVASQQESQIELVPEEATPESSYVGSRQESQMEVSKENATAIVVDSEDEAQVVEDEEIIEVDSAPDVSDVRPTEFEEDRQREVPVQQSEQVSRSFITRANLREYRMTRSQGASHRTRYSRREGSSQNNPIVLD